MTFENTCVSIERILDGAARQEIVEETARARTLEKALRRLRELIRENAWPAGGDRVTLGPTVKAYDERTRQDGFHVLNDWDGIADHVNLDTIPVDVLNYLIEKRGAEPTDAVVLAILLDYHFLHLLALLSVRVWDDGDPDANVDRVDRLLRTLQGPAGSGQQFSADAETLLLIATSHYELDERGYDRLLEKTRQLNAGHRLRIALGHAASMGCHLRFGFEATYGRDTGALRKDNGTDYPWLCFALATLMQEYARLHEAGVYGPDRDALVEALLNGLTADARAFVGDHPPPSLSASERDRSGFRELFLRYRQDLLDEFQRFRPTEQSYSPLSFFFNFSHNVLKGAVIDGLLWSEPWHLTLNDLLRGAPGDAEASEARETLAKTLMGYARANPHRIRGQLMPVIVYDPAAGRQAFSVTMRKLRE